MPDDGSPKPRRRLACAIDSAGAMRRLAGRIGRLAPPGLVIALCGGLGSGKTTFVQGLAEGLAVPPHYIITSPTFTLINDYPGRLPLYHADLYRLGEGCDIEEIGLLERMDGRGILAIEWAELARRDLPAARLEVRLAVTGADRRRALLDATGLAPSNLVQRVAAWGRGKVPPAG